MPDRKTKDLLPERLTLRQTLFGGIKVGDTFSIISIGFLVAYLALGLYAGRCTKTVEDHCVMARSASAFLIVGTLIASNLSSVTFTGFTATAMTKGPLALISQFGASVTGSLFLGLVAGKYFYRMKLLTLPEFFSSPTSAVPRARSILSCP